jgi:hypothetical protein
MGGVYVSSKLAGHRASCTAAAHTDIATFCWVVAGPYAGLEFDEFPKLKAWVDKIMARDAMMEGLNVPEPFTLLEALKDPAKLKQMAEEAQAMMVSGKKQ